MAGGRHPGFLSYVPRGSDNKPHGIDDGTMARTWSRAPAAITQPNRNAAQRGAQVRPPNAAAIIAEERRLARTNPINRRNPTRAPFVQELLRDPVVQAALDQAWRDTQADDSAHGNPNAREQGGWIYLNLRTGQLTIRRSRRYPPNRFSISLDPPDIVEGSAVVGTFHTHPSDPFAPAQRDRYQFAGDRRCSRHCAWPQRAVGHLRPAPPRR